MTIASAAFTCNGSLSCKLGNNRNYFFFFFKFAYKSLIELPFPLALQGCRGRRVTVPIPFSLIDEPVIYLL